MKPLDLVTSFYGLGLPWWVTLIIVVVLGPIAVYQKYFRDKR